MKPITIKLTAEETRDYYFSTSTPEIVLLRPLTLLNEEPESVRTTYKSWEEVGDYPTAYYVGIQADATTDRSELAQLEALPCWLVADAIERAMIERAIAKSEGA